jgi:hypothetical protein
MYRCRCAFGRVVFVFCFFLFTRARGGGAPCTSERKSRAQRANYKDVSRHHTPPVDTVVRDDTRRAAAAATAARAEPDGRRGRSLQTRSSHSVKWPDRLERDPIVDAEVERGPRPHRRSRREARERMQRRPVVDPEAERALLVI